MVPPTPFAATISHTGAILEADRRLDVWAVGLRAQESNAEEVFMQVRVDAQARDRCGKVTDMYVGLMAKIIADQTRMFMLAGDIQNAKSVARELLALAARTHADAHLEFAMSVISSSKVHAE